MALFEDLSIKVSADTADFQAGAEAVESQLGDLNTEAIQTAGALQVLSGRADAAGDNVSQAGNRASVTAGQFSALSGSASATSTSFMGLSATTIGALIPAIVTLGAALTPVLAALTGFVAVAGAIGAIGIVGVIGAIATNTEMLKEEAMETLAVFKEEFAPVFDLMASAIVVLLEEFEEIIPELVPAQSVVSRLTANFLDLGSAFIDVLPALTELAVQLAEEFLPPFVTFVEDTLPGAPDAIAGLVDHFREFLPMLMDMGRALGDLLPPLTEFGWTALRVIAPALGRLNSAFIDVLDFVNGLAGGMDQLVAQASLLAPVLVPLVSFLGGPVTLALAAVVAGAIGLAKAFQTNFADIRSYAQGLWNEIQDVMPQIRGAIESFLSGVDFEQITNAVGDFEDALGNQLMQTLEDLKPVFDDFQTFLADNEEEFALLGDAAGEFLTSLINIATTMVNVVYPAVRSVLIPALETMIKVADLGLSIIGDMVRLFQEVRAGDFEGAVSVMQQSESPAALADLVTPGENITQQRLEGAIQNQIEVIIEGELPEESIKSVTAEEINNTNRRTRRNQGRQPNPN